MQNKEIICLASGAVVFLLLFVNLKQMSFVARLVMVVSVFVIGWVCVEASMKVYVMSHINANGQLLAVPQNQTVAPFSDARNQTEHGGPRLGLNLNLNANETAGNATTLGLATGKEAA